jgi:hypothetical protein
MRAVWSFWSRPHRDFYHRNWYSERAHLMCWALSVAEAARHFAETWLVTDDLGAELLAGALGLPFTRVDNGLEALNRDAADPEWWVLGKLAAYAAQDTPFVHLDADVILWKPLPTRLHEAAVFAQNPEHFDFYDQSLYRADNFVRTVLELGGWLPDEWHRYARLRRNGALCCGILGGTAAEFLARYGQLASEIIRHPRNAAAWQRIGIRDNILVEQYFLAACLEAAADDATAAVASPAGEVAYLFPSSAHAFDPDEAERAGYTHLIGDAKANPSIAARLDRRVKAAHPQLHRRCLRALGERE